MKTRLIVHEILDAENDTWGATCTLPGIASYKAHHMFFVKDHLFDAEIKSLLDKGVIFKDVDCVCEVDTLDVGPSDLWADGELERINVREIGLLK